MHWTKTAAGKRRLAEIKEARREKRQRKQLLNTQRDQLVDEIHASSTKKEMNRTVGEALEAVEDLLAQTNRAVALVSEQLSSIYKQLQS